MLYRFHPVMQLVGTERFDDIVRLNKKSSDQMY